MESATENNRYLLPRFKWDFFPFALSVSGRKARNVSKGFDTRRIK